MTTTAPPRSLSTPTMGPLCDAMTAIGESGGCYHDSCQQIEAGGRIALALGPLCISAERGGYCQHASCLLIDPPQAWCPTCHGWQLAEFGSGSGFAGGRVYWAQLACGCYDVDESADVAAAR